MVRRIPSLNWLRVFEAAARAGSFARAAEILNISPPAVGQQIKALETHLGRDLFTRGPQSVSLTDAGRALLPAVAHSLHSIEIATDNLFGPDRRASLRVQCTLLFSTGWLALRLPRFQQAHPDIRVALTSAIRDDEFRPDEADLRISFGQPPGPQEDMDPLFGEWLTPVAPPAISREVRTPEDLARWPLIEIATHRANWFAILPDDGPDPAFTYTDNTLSAFALAAGGGIALDRAPATGDLARRYGLEPCLADHAISGVQGYALIYPARTALSRPARVFRDWLLAEVAEHPR